MNKSTFNGAGGFVLHGVTLSASLCRFSAWYDTDGHLLDAERLDVRQRSYPATQAQRTDLVRLGRIWSA